MPTSALRRTHHGAGLIDIFQHYRDLVPEFEHELFFRGFLVAFGHHVRETLQRDSDSHPVTHWWRGPLGTTDSQFADSSQGHAWNLFNQAGRQQLAHNLAVETFRALELYYSHGCYKAFFESAAKLVGSDFLEGYLESMPAEIAAEPVPEVPAISPSFTISKEAARVAKNKKISEKMLSKRAPKIIAIAPGRKLTDAEKKALRWESLSEIQKEAEREKKAARRKELRNSKKNAVVTINIEIKAGMVS